jgi:hypothetical protein
MKLRITEADRQFRLGNVLIILGYEVYFEHCERHVGRFDILICKNKKPLGIVECKKTSRKRTTKIAFIEKKEDIEQLTGKKNMYRYFDFCKKEKMKLIYAKLPVNTQE